MSIRNACVRVIAGFPFLFFLFLGCGVKTPVVSPDTNLPKAVSDFQIQVHGMDLLFSWPAPGEKSTARLSGYKIFSETDRSRSEQGCRRFQELASLDLKGGGKGWVRKGRIFYRLRVHPEWFGQTIHYIVIAVGRKGYAGRESKEISVHWVQPPSPPEEVRAIPGNRSVRLQWDPGGKGKKRIRVNIYRKERGGDYPIHPLNTKPVEKGEYVDRKVRNGVSYFYRLRTVASDLPPWIESEESEEVSVQPEDREPPAPPRGLDLIQGEGVVRLFWEENSEEDLAGYRVYRRSDGGEFRRIGEIRKPTTFYTDREVKRGNSYEYYVSAFDTAPKPNESRPSKTVTAHF